MKTLSAILMAVGTPNPTGFAAPQALAPRFAYPIPPPFPGVPLVMVHTPPPVPAIAPAAIARAQMRKLRQQWLAISRRGGRNAAEGGPRTAPRPIIVPPRTEPRTDPPTPEATPQAPAATADLPPPIAAAPLPPRPSSPSFLQPMLPDRNFLGAR